MQIAKLAEWLEDEFLDYVKPCYIDSDASRLAEPQLRNFYYFGANQGVSKKFGGAVTYVKRDNLVAKAGLIKAGFRSYKSNFFPKK